MEFVERATTGFEAYPRVGRAVDARGGRARHRRPGRGDPRARARLRPRASNAQLCWTLGITEHHNAVDNVFALINLALLTGKVGSYGSGLQPLRGQNNVQGGGDMGALPNRLPGFQDSSRTTPFARGSTPRGASTSRRSPAST